jgi:hypothetical protein
VTREEHNREWGVNRQPNEYVCCHTGGYGELSQYDPNCPACWLGHLHTWDEHDAYISRPRGI